MSATTSHPLPAPSPAAQARLPATSYVYRLLADPACQFDSERLTLLAVAAAADIALHDGAGYPAGGHRAEQIAVLAGQPAHQVAGALQALVLSGVLVATGEHGVRLPERAFNQPG
jgi:hypothetical protein